MASEALAYVGLGALWTLIVWVTAASHGWRRGYGEGWETHKRLTVRYLDGRGKAGGE